MTGRSLAESLRELMAQQTPDGRTLADRLVGLIVAKALAGDIRFIRLIFERLEGKAVRRTTEADQIRFARLMWDRLEGPRQAVDGEPAADPADPAKPLTIRLGESIALRRRAV